MAAEPSLKWLVLQIEQTEVLAERAAEAEA